MSCSLADRPRQFHCSIEGALLLVIVRNGGGLAAMVCVVEEAADGGVLGQEGLAVWVCAEEVQECVKCMSYVHDVCHNL